MELTTEHKPIRNSCACLEDGGTRLVIENATKVLIEAVHKGILQKWELPNMWSKMLRNEPVVVSHSTFWRMKQLVMPDKTDNLVF